MKKTLQEEKERVFEIMRKLTNESIGLSILGGMHNMAIENIKEIRNTLASGLSDEDFKELIMNAVNVILSDTRKKIKILMKIIWKLQIILYHKLQTMVAKWN